MGYSAFRIAKEALTGHKGWKPVWRKAEPKPGYDIIIIGGGGHGLAAAHYLASKFDGKNIAVLEKGWIGGGNVGRNTTIIRSNYMLNGNEAFYEMSLKLWEGLEQDVNYNAMVSQRGIINLFHSDGQRDAYIRRGNAMQLHGADAVLLEQDGVRKQYPFLNFDNARFPIQGGLWQPRGGTVRHDAVAWGYAHAADKSPLFRASSLTAQGIFMSVNRIKVGLSLAAILTVIIATPSAETSLLSKMSAKAACR